MKMRIESPAIVGAGKTVVELDGVDYAKVIRGMEISMGVGDLLGVRIDVVLKDGLSFEGDLRRIEVPAQTAELLRHAGWLPPLHEVGPLPSETAARIRELSREHHLLLERHSLEYVATVMRPAEVAA